MMLSDNNGLADSQALNTRTADSQFKTLAARHVSLIGPPWFVNDTE